jgi:hypothetical protein
MSRRNGLFSRKTACFRSKIRDLRSAFICLKEHYLLDLSVFQKWTNPGFLKSAYFCDQNHPVCCIILQKIFKNSPTGKVLNIGMLKNWSWLTASTKQTTTLCEQMVGGKLPTDTTPKRNFGGVASDLEKMRTLGTKTKLNFYLSTHWCLWSIFPETITRLLPNAP